ncbi:hypothetical protein BKA70DRAFT_1222651 [Coprinopsis sp. MPI-PUGE-AT-0042]|nr:hypothetical protein BKA70DRAFT_1222651 [Coprinopsis sp. MPI-PUGE-AT-0042]
MHWLGVTNKYMREGVFLQSKIDIMTSQQPDLNPYLRLTFARTVKGFGVSASFYVEAPTEIRRRRRPYVITSLFILLLSCSAAIFDGIHIYNILLGVTPGPEHSLGGYKVIMDNLTLGSVASLTFDIALWIADGVLVYRCYVVWFDRPWVSVIPAILWLTNIGINLRTYIPLDFSDNKLNVADICLREALNILITTLISIRLIRVHRRLTRDLPDTTHKLYIGVVAILVESAAPQAVFGIGSFISLALSATGASRTTWQNLAFFDILYTAAAILSPQLIIFRVATGASWSNKAETSAALSRPIEFAGQPQTSSDEESIVVEA